MSIEPAPENRAAPIRITVDRYLALVEENAIDPNDRVELLEGVVVAMSPASSRHATAVSLADDALRTALSGRAAVRVQCPLVLGRYSVPEPDVAVVRGETRDYARAHPTSALLVIEVADTTFKQDRLTKAAIYAAAGVPEYWIVNLQEDRVEVHRAPDSSAARYGEITSAGPGECLAPVALPGTSVAVDALLPGR